ncbi:MAG: dihydrolipoyl dehydrogenase [Proteobacteria bacterium]|nr:dihydrolipoyl dehydrogenase [Pseudomonadota bacterium]MDA1355763.1 dihydrolipoyl dehydrogenase [Pseudomonadota bacterium]
MAEKSFDVVILGGGPGGYVAAIRAAQLGLKTAVVEREHLGGICLNWGCIPTKALLRVSEIRHTLDRLDEFGLSCGEISFDISKIVKRSRQISGQLSKGVEFLLKKHKVTVIMGDGRLAGGGKVAVSKDGKEIAQLSATHIIVATGARARELPGLVADGDLVWTYKEAMVPKAMPKSLLVVGSGAIGMEFASFYSDLGAGVTVVEVLPRVLPVEDEEISAFAEKQFKKQGMTIFTGATVQSLKKKGVNAVSATIQTADGKVKQLDFERAILAVGIVGNVENIGLEESGVQVDRGHIKTGPYMETDASGIYAIGDVTGAPWLAHKAMHEGVLCVEKIAGVEGVHPLNASNVPGCTYCRPQIASVGLSEAAALEKGHEVRVGRFPFMGNGKAIALGETEGMVKTVFDAKTGELLGAHMIGAEVTELIQGYTIAKTMECTEADLMQTIFPHPTLSEMMHESVLDAYDRVLHI